MGFKLFIGLLLLFILFHMIMYFLNRTRILGREFVYKDSIQAFRKILYAIFILSILTGILLGELSVSNWSFMLILAGIIVFVDLSIILTPSILKLGSAEFKYADEIEDIIKTTDRIQVSTLNRAGTMSAIIQDLGSYINNYSNDPIDRREDLEELLNVYGVIYGLKSEIWKLNMSESILSNEELLENTLKAEITQTLEEIELMYGFNVDDNREDKIKDLVQSSVVTQENDEFMIVPVYVMNDFMLVVVENKKANILEIDAMHITNLIVLYYAFKPFT